MVKTAKHNYGKSESELCLLKKLVYYPRTSFICGFSDQNLLLVRPSTANNRGLTQGGHHVKPKGLVT